MLIRFGVIGGGAYVGMVLAVALVADPAIGGRPMTSLRLSEPRELAGTWILSVAGDAARCTLTLGLAPGASDQPLVGAAACPPGLGLSGAVKWRPVPDGLQLAADDGRTIAMFEPAGANRFVWQRRSGPVTLQRRAEPPAAIKPVR